MNHYRVHDKSENVYYSWRRLGDFEYANPLDKLIETVVGVSYGVDTDTLFLLKQDPTFSSLCDKYPHVIDRVLQKTSFKLWEKYVRNLLAQQLPNNIFDLLGSSSKREQIKILKGVSLSMEQLMLFILKASEDYDYTFSQYFSEHYPKNINPCEMPTFAHHDEVNEDVAVIGETTLSANQIKAVIHQRHAVVAKFIDKGKNWHCFFQTYKSIAGEETGEYPHLHYISHSWGLSREEVLFQLKSKNYKLPSSMPHIDFVETGEFS